MIYSEFPLVEIFGAGVRTDIIDTIRGPCGPKNMIYVFQKSTVICVIRVIQGMAKFDWDTEF